MLLKILFVALLCVPLFYVSVYLISKSMDEVLKRKQ